MQLKAYYILKLVYTVEMLDRYENNPRMKYQKDTNKVIRYLQEMKDYMFIYRRSVQLEVIEYLDANFVNYFDNKKVILGFILMLA